MKHIMALDQGTTSSRCIIFNEKAEIVKITQKEFKQHYPNPGWVEHDPTDILESQLSVAREALASSKISIDDIASIGITNQRETCILWNKYTGKPYCNAIVWQCRRTSEICKELKEKGYEKAVKEKTGLLLDPYFSGTKIKWIFDNIDGVREDALAGEVLFGTVDTWLIWNLSGGKCHVTDVSNASRTMLFNINTLTWDEDLLSMLDIPSSILPKIVSNADHICYTDPSVFGSPILISGIAGDQQAALFGQGCFSQGDCKNTYGTGCFLLMNTGDKPNKSDSGLISTVAWKLGDKITYAAEGSVFIGGAAIQWLRDEMHLIESAPDSESEAQKVESSNGVYVVPAFTGLGAPYWNPDARGIITGITRGTSYLHIIRATLEAIAYQVEDILSLMKSETGKELVSLSVDGGASRNNLLMQFQADISGIEVIRKTCTETTALGAAMLSGLGSGVYDSLDDIKALLSVEKTFIPTMKKEERQSLYNGWKEAIKKCGSN